MLRKFIFHRGLVTDGCVSVDPLDGEIIERLFKKDIREGEEKLLLAVLADAIEHFQKEKEDAAIKIIDSWPRIFQPLVYRQLRFRYSNQQYRFRDWRKNRKRMPEKYVFLGKNWTVRLTGRFLVIKAIARASRTWSVIRRLRVLQPQTYRRSSEENSYCGR